MRRVVCARGFVGGSRAGKARQSLESCRSQVFRQAQTEGGGGPRKRERVMTAKGIEGGRVINARLGDSRWGRGKGGLGRKKEGMTQKWAGGDDKDPTSGFGWHKTMLFRAFPVYLNMYEKNTFYGPRHCACVEMIPFPRLQPWINSVCGSTGDST